MPIRVKCGSCKKTLSVKDHLAGKKIKCPVCQGAVVVSAAAPPKTPSAETAKAAPKAPAPKKPIPTGRPVSTGVKAPPNGKKPAARPNGQPSTSAPPQEPEPPAPPPEEVEAEAAALFAEKPPAVDEAPKTFDFECEWCSEKITLPIEMGGKRTQCTSMDCRRITKIPMPTVQKPRDWRKMDRVGPAAAIVNQPEQLANAWGTENTTKARQDSLAKAGAIDLPPKPPLGVFGILQYFVIACFFFSLLGGLVLGAAKLFTGSKQVKDIAVAKGLLTGKPPQVTKPVLAAQVHCTIALMYMREGKHGVTRPADQALEHFQGARSLIRLPDVANEPSINEQLFLIELALAAIDLGGTEEEWIVKSKQQWPTMQEYLRATLDLIKTPEVQLMAAREVSSRLLEKNSRDTPETQKIKADMAFALASGLANPHKPTPIMSQQIALLLASGQEDVLKSLFKAEADRDILKELSAGKAIKKLTNAPLRIGFAEGYARKGEYAEADRLIDVDGPPRDQVEACLGVASIALARKPDEAPKFIDKALAIVREAAKAREKQPVQPSPWHLLHLANLAARTENEAALEEVKGFLSDPPFKVRVLLEVVRAKCDKGSGAAPVELLADLEAADKDGTTLALAWHCLAQQHVRKGQSRSKVQKTLTEHVSIPGRGELATLRPIVEIGAVRGGLK